MERRKYSADRKPLRRRKHQKERNRGRNTPRDTSTQPKCEQWLQTHTQQTPPPPAPRLEPIDRSLLSDQDAVMENSTEELQEGGGANTAVKEEEAELMEEKTHNNLKGALNGVMEAGGGEKLQNGDRGGGTMGAEGGGGGGDLSSINAMMSAVMSAAGSINGGGEADGGSGVTSANSSAGPSPSPSPSKSITAAMRAPPSRNARRTQDTKDDSSAYICPLCDKNCQTQHQLTMHIRQHNADTGATDHSCSICGKCLSSASSLDRHMLVHSGERPYKCNVCGQTFTTNGNMHRHMKIHEKDPASGLLPVSPPSPTKRRRPSVKRRPGPEEEAGEEPPSKKVVEDAAGEEATAVRGSEEELLPCPICFKTCSSRLDLDAHMDSHPDTALRCDLCCLSFRTHRGLLRHNAGVHKLLPQDPSGRPFIQNNPSIPTGFNDLAFIDFSCRKFAHIAQVWCETNLRRCISKFHRFVCDDCDKAFPLRSALDLHKKTSHPDEPAGQEDGAAEDGAAEDGAAEDGAAEDGLEGPEEEEEEEEEEEVPSEQESFMELLGLQHVSKVKSGPTDDEVHQAHLDSIKVIHVEPPSSSLPQEPAAAYLSGGVGLTLGGLAALSIPLLEASGSALQGLSQRDALSLLSLPFQTGFLLQPDGGAAAAGSSAAKPGEAGGAGLVELADIQQILKVATAAPNQMGLPPLAKAPGFTGGQGQVQGQKAMPPLKPKPPISPRSSLTATTPPPLQSSQQASLGCISPSLPPPTPTLFKTPSSSSSSSSSAGNGGQMDAECMGDAHTPLSDSPPAATTAVHEEAGLSGRKPGTKAGNNAGSAKGSFPCRFCDQVFAFSGVLQAHMRFHLGILPHQCNICDYVAPDKATLIRHLRTHSGERPYVCRVCHYPFTVKANCERHLRKKHAKTSRKDIEKNIKYVTSTTTANIAAAITAATTTATQDTETGYTGAETTCRFCGEDLKSYRALQIHLRTHNGCQRKPFECRRCGAAFLAKRNCIHHLLKQHPEVQEREIEEHIATLQPAATVAAARAAPGTPMALNGISQPPVPALQAVKVEANVVFPAELDQPLDFSAKGRGAGGLAGSPGVKLESVSPSFDCSDQPIDLSIPSKRQRREAMGERKEIKTEHGGGSIIEQQNVLSKDEKTAGALPPLHPHPQLGCYQLPPGSTPPPASLPAAARAQRLKPLLPKPASSPSAALKELPPLASIAQIIHSVSGAPDLLKREATSLEAKPQTGASSQADPAADAPGPSAGLEPQSDDVSEGSSRRRSRKKPAALALKEKVVSSSGIDLESSGEFASVEKMLATTDANKFSTYLQTGAAELGAKRDGDGGGGGGGEEKEGGVREEVKPTAAAAMAAVMAVPQSKGKKNAYSNSVQKMTCPFCPRVFPWASSLQRHMLTHTGQKPFPCPRCDAFFSTKSNCERHLLRKHGVTHRTLRRNGAIGKKDGDEGSQESAGSQSETEQVAPEAQDLSSIATAADSGPAPAADSPAPSESTQPSPAHKPSQGCSPAAGAGEQQEAESTKQPDQQEAPETSTAPGKQPPQSCKVESTDDDDCNSNKSLDLNFGKKLIDFKLSTSSSGSAQEEPPCQPSPSSAPSTSAPQPATESPEEEKEKEKEKPAASSSGSPATKQQPEYKHVCRVCKKSFRYATTLARHERAHLSEETPTPLPAEDASPVESKPAEEDKEEKEVEMEAEEGRVKGGESDGGDSGDSEEEEKEERSNEETSEPKSLEGGEASGGRVDKRKKICKVCGKRFWSLQDLTRHMRSHTGERPYRCQTCERTFTLKHSLVRHQRIHLKPRGADGSSATNDDASEDGDSCTPTPTSTCPPSENESESGSTATGAKDLEEEDVKEEEEEEEEEESAVIRAEIGADSGPPAAVAPEDVEDKSGLDWTRQPSVDSTPGHQAIDTKTTTSTDSLASDLKATPDSNTSKDPSSSSSPPGEAAAAAPAEGFIQGLLEIHTKPPLEHILPNGEPPLVGVD